MFCLRAARSNWRPPSPVGLMLNVLFVCLFTLYWHGFFKKVCREEDIITNRRTHRQNNRQVQPIISDLNDPGKLCLGRLAQLDQHSVTSWLFKLGQDLGSYRVHWPVLHWTGSLCAQSGSAVNIAEPVRHMQSEHHRQCNKHMHK